MATSGWLIGEPAYYRAFLILRYFLFPALFPLAWSALFTPENSNRCMNDPTVNGPKRRGDKKKYTPLERQRGTCGADTMDRWEEAGLISCSYFQ
ncbi:MAG: hypothetical protein J3Q66DRAFT_143727 [Benniella sp.]|nr:MAG: hypothetical protein J3Q66DRAFT_143727 [Benniella sp.]